jgi:hypothetical protein
MCHAWQHRPSTQALRSAAGLAEAFVPRAIIESINAVDAHPEVTPDQLPARRGLEQSSLRRNE